MRLYIALLVVFCLVFAGCAGPTHEYEGEDLYLLSGDMRLPAVYTPVEDSTYAVIFLTNEDRSMEEWTTTQPTTLSFFEELGFTTLTFDFSGVSDGDYSQVNEEISAAVRFLESQGEDKIALFGVDRMANLALRYATYEDDSIDKVFLLSPRKDWEGDVISRSVLDDYDGELYMFVGKLWEPFGAEVVWIKDYYDGPKKLRIYVSSEHGFELLHKHYEDVMEYTLSWLFREV